MRCCTVSRFGGGRVRYANHFLQSVAYREAIANNAISRDEFATNRPGSYWSGLMARLTGELGSDNGNVNVIAYGDHDMVALTETPASAAVRSENTRNLGRLRMVGRTQMPGHDGASAL